MKTDRNERVNLRVLELKDLIAGPLVATIDADSLSTQRYLDYLLKIAFESYDPTTGQTGAMRMLTFNYKSYDQYGARLQTVSIPVLTLVPLPLLQVQEADFDFDLHVLDASSRKRTDAFSFDTGQAEPAADDASGYDTRLRVTLAATGNGSENQTEKRQSRLDANLKVHVKMRHADMPGGLSVLLNQAINRMMTETSENDCRTPSENNPL